MQYENAAFSYSETNKNSLLQNTIFSFQRVERRETVGERVRKRQMQCESFFYKENSQNTDIRLHNSNANYIKEEKLKRKRFPEVYLPS